MLVLSRFEKQRVFIGDDIILTIVEVKDGSVRLGFDAPRHIPIHREEVAKRIQAEVEGTRPEIDDMIASLRRKASRAESAEEAAAFEQSASMLEKLR